MWAFIKDMLSAEDGISSKRVNGTLCILTTLIILYISVIFDIRLDSIQADILSTVFYGGVLLLGINLLERFKK